MRAHPVVPSLVLVATLVQKYGLPDEVTTNRLIRHNKGPWKFTELVNEEIPHGS